MGIKMDKYRTSIPLFHEQFVLYKGIALIFCGQIVDLFQNYSYILALLCKIREFHKNQLLRSIFGITYYVQDARIYNINALIYVIEGYLIS